MFNFSGSEIFFLLILGLVVLGPEKLPPVLRKMGQVYGQFKKMTGDAQSEFRDAFAEPIREIQQAANEYKTVFTDAASDFKNDVEQTVQGDAAIASSSEDPEPIFIPYEGSDISVEESATSNTSVDDLEPTLISYDDPKQPPTEVQ